MGYQVPRVSGDIGQDAFQDMQRLSRASRLYIGLPRLAQVYGFMADHGFRLVSFYRFYYQHDRAAWTDALFVDPDYGNRKIADPT